MPALMVRTASVFGRRCLALRCRSANVSRARDDFVEQSSVFTLVAPPQMRGGMARSVRALFSTSSDAHFDRSTVSGPHGNYLSEYEASLNDPERFWENASAQLEWFVRPRTILSRSSNQKLFSWFQDGSINTCYNCLDVHVNDGRGKQDALIYDSPVTSTKKRFTFDELLDLTSRFAGALTELGVEKGDRVVVYMPMIPEAIISMLACARIGAVHSVVFGGFAAPELATRIADCQPKVVISASAGVEAGRIVPYKPLLDRALELASHKVERCVIVQRGNVQRCEMGPMDVDFEEIIGNGSPVNAVPLPSTHPHYVLYTSGTTGKPKGVLRDTGSYATALKWSMGAFYNSNAGDVFWAASDIGWVVGHSYIVYAPLLQGCTTILYEGKPTTPDAGVFWRVIEEYGVKTMFTAPTAFRAIKQADPKAQLVHNYNLKNFETLFLAGERTDPDTLHWAENALSKYNVPVIDHWWQTELGWPGVGNAIGLGHIPVRYGACAAPVPGYDLHVFDDSGNEVQPGRLGALAIKLPLPPGTLPSLYKNDERYINEYLKKFPGFYNTGDAGLIDEDGYVHIMGRTDDIINTAGHRLSTGAMEEILLDHPDVADCAVVGMIDEVKGHVPIGFVTTVAGTTTAEDKIREDLVKMVRSVLGPVASFKKVAVVKGLPKTRSGKILRGTMSKIANGEAYTITPTIEDPSIFDWLAPEIVKLAKE